MAYVTHGPCPKCNSRDNLATYADGHEWCFGCKYYKPPPNSLERRASFYAKSQVVIPDIYPIARDAVPYIPHEPLTWIKKYGISDEEIKRNNFLWSEEKQQLIFPIYGGNDEIICWQARNFDPERSKRRKYFSQGKLDEVLHILENETVYPETIVLTEDLISAIKVSRVCSAIPLFGAYASDSRLNRLRRRYSKLVVWLDYDKLVDARKAVSRASRIGFDASAIHTKLDPKELSDRDIQKELTNVK
jgi:hypothetical protein